MKTTLAILVALALVGCSKSDTPKAPAAPSVTTPSVPAAPATPTAPAKKTGS